MSALTWSVCPAAGAAPEAATTDEDEDEQIPASAAKTRYCNVHNKQARFLVLHTAAS